MNLFPERLCLNGMRVEIQSILKDEKAPCCLSIEPDIIDFLAQWYDSKSYLAVQTSGSTGVPKSIQLEKQFVAESALRTLAFFHLLPGQRILLCLPLRYIAGKLMVIRALLGELDLCTADASDDFSFLSGQGASPFHFAAMVPHQVAKLLKNPESFTGISALLIGGSLIPAAIEYGLRNVATACFASYGMTETATHIALRHLNGPDASPWYHCLAGVSVRLSAKDCLSIHMPGLSEEHLVTNDLAFLLDRRTFRILGRADNVIISGGIKYFPEDLERKLDDVLSLPFFIGSLPDETLGNRIVLVIEGLPDAKLEEKLNQVCRQRMPRYERPRQIVFKKSLLRTESGKIIRRFSL